MAPKRQPLDGLGGVSEHGGGWRADVRLSSTQRERGPTRISKADAEADLHAMRTAESREDVVRVVAELVACAVAVDVAGASQPARSTAAAASTVAEPLQQQGRTHPSDISTEASSSNCVSQPAAQARKRWPEGALHDKGDDAHLARYGLSQPAASKQRTGSTQSAANRKSSAANTKRKQPSDNAPRIVQISSDAAHQNGDNDKAGEASHALVIERYWLNLILNGRKTWEIRGKPTKLRCVISLAQSGSKHLFGEARVGDCLEIDRADFPNHVEKHFVQDVRMVKYSHIFAWVLEDVKRYPKPRPYTHPQGAISLVKLR